MFGFFRALSGWLAGCAAATVVIVGLPIGFSLVSEAHAKISLATLASLLGPCLPVFAITCVMTAVPAAFLIGLSVDLRARSIVFFSIAGSVLGALCISLLARSLLIWTFWVGPLFAVAGLAAGVTYWLIAGRRAL